MSDNKVFSENADALHNLKTNDTQMQLDSMMKFSKNFAGLNRLVLRDLNGVTSSPTFYKYTKDQISTYLENPYNYEKQLREAMIYMYSASSHLRRIIKYFAGLSDYAYVVSPYKIDTTTAKAKTMNRNYRKALNLLSSMDIKNQCEDIVTVCFREDIFYGTMIVTSDNVIIQRLPSDYCKIAVIENDVFNVSFDFSYFGSNSQYLPLYPEEFQRKYEIYTSDNTQRWQELDSPTSFAIKCNRDIPTYAVPPFVGMLVDLFDLSDYRSLKLTKETLENYAMLVMKLGVNSDGEWEMDLGKAKEFWSNLSNVLPEEVGSVLSPMDIEKISFERSHTGDVDTITSAEEHVFSSAGVSSLLFSNPKASANALTLSIKTDQAMTYSVVKSIETALNRFLQSQSYGKNYKITFLDCSPFNRKECGDAYLKACSYGLPMVSYYCASQGLSQAEMDCMNFLESDVLNLTERFKPLQLSSTQSVSSSDAENNGRPTNEIGEGSEAAEIAENYE